jgi:hypothetical protein
MSPLKLAALAAAVFCISACDKKDDAAAPASTGPAAATSASHGVDEERKAREHEHDERFDGGREREHEDRQPK